MIISTEDFKGIFNLNINSRSDDDLLELLSYWEKKCLIEIFGLELYNIIVSDLDSNGNPQTSRIVDLFSEKDIIRYGVDQFYEGLKITVLQFSYFEYFSQRESKSTSSGLRSTKSENSIKSTARFNELVRRYNDYVENACLIQFFCRENSEVYSEFKGSKIVKSGF